MTPGNLPLAADQTLLSELGVVIGSGWRLVDRVHTHGRIRHLLALAGPKPHEAYGTIARRFLEMLNVALIEAPGDLSDDEGEPFLSDDQSLGLRILFGVHPDYRWRNVDVRRSEAGALLLGRSQIEANTFYKTHEGHAKELALECLRARFGQENALPPRSYESVRRQVSAIVGPTRRITSVTMSNVYRALVEDLSFVRNWFHLEQPELVEAIAIREVSGVINHQLERWPAGGYRLTFQLSHPVALGQQFAWSYERTYRFAENASGLVEDRIGVSGRNDGFGVSFNVEFHCDPAPTIWRYSRRKPYFPIEPGSELLLTPDERGRVSVPESWDTSELRVYGIAWRW